MAYLFQSNLESDNPSQLCERDLFMLASSKVLDASLIPYLSAKLTKEKISERINDVYTLLIESAQSIESGDS